MGVSAIVPVYNVEKYLERCVGSLISQTTKFDEIILIDDGSEDSSGIICDRLCERNNSIRVIHQDNQGLSATRNRGIEEVKYELLTFVDSDDWVSPTYLETLLDLLEASDADVAICALARVREQNEFGEIAVCKLSTEVFSAEEFLDVMLRFDGNRCVHYACGKLFKKSVLEKNHFPVGIYNEDVEGFFKVLLNSTRIVETNAMLYAYFVNPQSITGCTFGENYLNLEDVWHRVYKLTEIRRPELLDKVEYNEKRTSFTILTDMIIHGDKESDKQYDGDRKRLQRQLRQNLAILLKGPMSLGRKIAMLAYVVSYKFVRFLYRSFLSLKR
ncbi:glycosyltransferase [Adlercreutzia sp. ZJ154]|uniref:glycosyltransferase family 2 protein n=1 Tax=Adlercreutzia sp. ZJ154 TaxID=2709790 RepID=UPI0013EB9CC7|nr:glycosyltransferase [Adlercreutzia sp. ZJ154]